MSALDIIVISAAVIVSCVAIRAVVVRYVGRSPADRAHRRALGRDGRRAIRRAAREDRAYRKRQEW
jgi:hypothetical protein